MTTDSIASIVNALVLGAIIFLWSVYLTGGWI
jgi:hypothetical protein